jgi:2-iminobutanoate/2-iminopropanoate deaminase
MEAQVVFSAGAAAPIGPYSQGVKAEGRLVFTSGQIPLDPTGALVPGGIDEQTHAVFANLKAVLNAAGSGLSQVVKTTVFLKSMGDFSAMNAIYASYFNGPVPPARSTVEVARLPKDVLVEIEAIAIAENN